MVANAELEIRSIDISGRSRKHLGDVAALAGSIDRLGLLHPVVITPDKKLVVGRRRIEAFKHLGRDKIPVRVVTNVDELQLLLEAERDENTCREAYTPEEAVHLGGRIEKVVEKLAKAAQREGGKKGGQAEKGKVRKTLPKLIKDDSKRTTSQASIAVGMSRPTYERAKAVVESGDRKLIDEMNRTGKVNGAHNKLRKREKLEQLEQKAANASLSKDEPLWTLIHADVIDGLGSVRDHHAAPRLIFADPPYNIGVDYGDGEKADKLPYDQYLLWFAEWIGACWEILAADGSLWVMIGDEYAAEYAMALKRTGFVVRSWIKWYETFGVNCSNNFNRTSRHIFYCVRSPKSFVFNDSAVNRPSDRQAKYGDKRASEGGKIWDDVWGVNPPIPRLTGTCEERIPMFPTQLPLALLTPIVKCASDPGDLVVDPFCGSATTGVASVTTGRRFVGIEKSEKFVDLADKRLRGVA